MKKLVVPADFKTETAKLIGTWSRSAEGIEVEGVYGSFPNAIFGSGRAGHTLPRIDSDRFVEYVQVLKKNGMGFSYTLNPSCWSNREYTSQGFLDILVFVTYLLECGVDRLVIAVPPLVEIARRHFPDLGITASVICRIDSVEKARFYEDLGADRINIPEAAARNFHFIDALATDIEAETQVIVNSQCIVNCPMREYHYNCQSHEPSSSEEIAPTTWMRRCNLMMLDPKSQLKRPSLIRPEDLELYEQHGVRIFKIIGREAAFSKSVMSIIKAYLHQRHTGSYFDLLPTPSNARHLFHLNNQELDGFLEFFVERRPLCQLGCYDCTYCEAKAQDIRFDRAEVDRLAETFRQAVSDYVEHGNRV